MNSLGPSDVTEANKTGPEIQCGYDMRLLVSVRRFWPLNILPGAQKKENVGPMNLNSGPKYSPQAPLSSEKDISSQRQKYQELSVSVGLILSLNALKSCKHTVLLPSGWRGERHHRSSTTCNT